MTEIEHNGTVAMTEDGGSAFPLPVSTDLDGREAIAYPGMSLRDWFAGQVQEPVRSDDLVPVPRDLISAACYAIANKAEAHNILRKLKALTLSPAPSQEPAAVVKAEATSLSYQMLGWQVRRPQEFLDKYPNASEFVTVIHETEREARVAGVPTKDMVNGNFPPDRLAAVVIRQVYALVNAQAGKVEADE